MSTKRQYLKHSTLVATIIFIILGSGGYTSCSHPRAEHHYQESTATFTTPPATTPKTNPTQATQAPTAPPIAAMQDIETPNPTTPPTPTLKPTKTVKQDIDVEPRGYSRKMFGTAWADVDHNGCDTRNDILRRDLTNITTKPGTRECIIISGVLSDPYTGKTIEFKKGNKTSSLIQIDHIVPLKYAWDHGASKWTEKQRTIFANDPQNLLAVDGKSNQAKSDKGLTKWMPNNQVYQCEYATKFVQITQKYGLQVDEAENTIQAAACS